MGYKIYATETFKTLYYSLEKDEQRWIDKIKKNLEGYPTGKILRYSWFREKKYGNKRLYYLIDEEKKNILLVSFASKKEQQKIIDFITLNMKELLKYLKSLD